MENEILTALGEVGMHIGMKLMGTVVGPSQEIDRTALANAVLESSVYQASLIVDHFGMMRQLQGHPQEFGFIVGIIATEQSRLVEYLTNLKLSVLADCSCDIDDTCARAMAALRR
jgi:hypothetical protein